MLEPRSGRSLPWAPALAPALPVVWSQPHTCFGAGVTTCQVHYQCHPWHSPHNWDCRVTQSSWVPDTRTSTPTLGVGVSFILAESSPPRGACLQGSGRPDSCQGTPRPPARQVSPNLSAADSGWGAGRWAQVWRAGHPSPTVGRREQPIASSKVRGVSGTSSAWTFDAFRDKNKQTNKNLSPQMYP